MKHFHERFDIELEASEVIERLIKRFINELFVGFIEQFGGERRERIKRRYCTEMGLTYTGRSITTVVPNDYPEILRAAEAL